MGPKEELIGTYKLIDIAGKLCVDNLEFPADRKFVCEYQGNCTHDCKTELEFERIEEDPQHVRVYCVRLKDHK